MNQVINRLLLLNQPGSSSAQNVQFANATGIYSLRRFNGYSGSVVRLRHLTTDVEQDFGFGADGWLDHNAIVAFYGSSAITSLLVVATIIYDHLGVGNWTQATEANMAYYGGLAYNGKPCLFFNRRDTALDHFFNATISTDSRDIAVHAVCRGIVCFFPGIASTDVIFSNGGNPSTFTLSDNTVFRGSSTRLDASTGAQSAEPLNIVNSGYRSHTSAPLLKYDYDHLTQSFTVFASTRLNTTALLGKRSNATNKQCGEFQELVIYKPSLTTVTQENELKDSARTAFGVLDKTKMVICDGDSITYGYASPNPINNPQSNSYPFKLARLLGETYAVWNFGVSGATLATIVTQGNWVTRTTMLGDTALMPIYVLWAGTNDIGTDQSLATCQSRLDNIVSLIRTAEPNCRIVFCTTISRDIFAENAGWETIRGQFNQYIRDTYSNTASMNYLCDLAANSLLGQTNSYQNTTYFDVDGDHLNSNGLTLVASIVHPVVASVV